MTRQLFISDSLTGLWHNIADSVLGNSKAVWKDFAGISSSHVPKGYVNTMIRPQGFPHKGVPLFQARTHSFERALVIFS